MRDADEESSIRTAGIEASGFRDRLAIPIDDDQIDRLAEIARNIVVGNTIDPSVQMGPLISRPHLERVEGMVERALKAPRARRLTELVVVSVLVDAGAGAQWRFTERETGTALGRSEGLAVASLAWAKRGGLSAAGEAYRVDASHDAISSSQDDYLPVLLKAVGSVAEETARLLRKMAEMQHGDGSWPWFPGGPGNDYITLYITTGFGRLRHLGAKVDTAAAVKGKRAVFEHSVSGRYPFLDHRR